MALFGALLAWAARRTSARGSGSRWPVAQGLAIALAGNEAIWYAYRYSTEGWRFPEGLPLQLCDLLVWLTVIAAWRLWQPAVEFVVLAGLSGAGMALLTPDLWAPWPSYPTICHFAVHGLIVDTALVLLLAGLARPRPGGLWRVFALTNGFAAFVGAFNAVFGTNYMYLCRKPAGASLLDWFGPWPVYLLAGELAALLLFGLLWLAWLLLDKAIGDQRSQPDAA